MAILTRRRTGLRPDIGLRLLNIPSLFLIVSFSILPIVYVVILSFYDLRLGGPPAFFIGLENFQFVLEDSSVRNAFWNTIYFSFLSVGIASLVGLGAALLLDSNIRGARWLVICIIVPWAIPEVVNALMWRWIYDPTYGALNALLHQVGILSDYTAWLSTPRSAMHAVIFAYAWKLVPLVVLIIYAGLRSIPDELYEAAQIDGAEGWQQFRYITYPLIAPSILVAVLFCVVWSTRAFDIVYLLTHGGPGEGTTLLSYFVFTKAFQFGDLGAAAAVACLLAALTLAITAFYLRALPQGDHRS